MTGSEIYLIWATIFSGIAAIIAFITVAICRLGYQREFEELLDEIEELKKKQRGLEILARMETQRRKNGGF